METLESEVVELLESSKYSNGDKACKYIGKDGRRILVYYLSNNGYISYYEISASLNVWEVLVNMPGHSKEDYALAQSRVIRLLPKDHMVTPGNSITVDGLKNWRSQVQRDYEYSLYQCQPFISTDDKNHLLLNYAYGFVFINEEALTYAIKLLYRMFPEYDFAITKNNEIQVKLPILKYKK